MHWYQNTDISSAFYLETFKQQHIKYTPEELLEHLEITDFNAHLDTIWRNSVKLFNEDANMLLFDYNDDEGKTIAFVLGVKDDDKFHIRHLNFADVTNIDKTVIREFLETCNYKIVTIRSRKGIPAYHDIISSLGFKTSDNGYFPSGYSPENHQAYEFAM